MPQTFFPGVQYEDARAAIEWLGRAFGFEEQTLVPGEGERDVAHAELRFGGGIVMLGSKRSDVFSSGKALIYVAVDDLDGHYQRAKAAGAEIVMEPFDTDYGSRDYAARDPEGHVWSFGTYRPEAGTAAT